MHGPTTSPSNASRIAYPVAVLETSSRTGTVAGSSA